MKTSSGRSILFLFMMLLVSCSTVWAAAGDLVWKYKAGGPINTSPAIGEDGTIYFGSDDNYLYAVNPDGDVMWRYETGDDIYSSPAIGNDGTIYFGSHDRYFYAVKPDGSLKWSYETGDNVESSPAIGSDGTIYFGSHDGTLYAFNPDGTLEWENNSIHVYWQQTSPVIGKDGTLYIRTVEWDEERHYIYFSAFNTDGTRKWKFSPGDEGANDISPSAIGSDGTIYFVSDDGYLYAVNNDGTLKWRYETGWWGGSTPAIGVDGTIYIGYFIDGEYLYALNPDGTEKWKTGMHSFTFPLLGSDGTIYGGTWCNFWAVSPDGDVIWEFNTEYETGLGAPNISDNGIIYVGAQNGNLYAIDSGTGAGLADSPWPKFRYDQRSTGSAQTIGLSTDKLKVLDVSAGSSGTGTFDIINLSNKNLVVTAISSDNEVFTVDPASTTIPPASSQTVTVTFSPTEDRGYTGTISIAGEDITLTIDVSGNMYPAGEEVFTFNIGEGQTTRSCPAINGDGTVYVCARNGYLYAFDPDGSVQWRFQTDGGMDCSPALSTNGDIYFNSGDGYLYAVTSEGTLKWKYSVGGNCSPAIGSDGTVYTGGSGNILYAVNPDGHPMWYCELDGNVQTSPAIGSDGTIYIGTDDWHLNAVNPDGTLKWKYKADDQIQSSPAIDSDGTVYVGSVDNHLYAINPDGSLKWKYKLDGNVHSSSPSIDSNGTIYIGTNHGIIYAVNSDGTHKWQFQANAGAHDASAVIGSDGTVYIGADDGYVYALTSAGELKWSYRAGNNCGVGPPTLDDNGILYFLTRYWDGNEDNYLIAIGSGTDSGLADSPWPKFHRNKRNTGSARQLAVSHNRIKIMDVPAGSSGTETFVIGNNGNTDLVVSLSSDNEVFTVDLSSATLAPDESRTVTVTFAPPEDRGYSGAITVTGGDETVEIGLYGNVYPAGEELWRFQTDSWIQSSPVIGYDGTIYFGSSDSYLYALNRDGTEKWRYQMPGGISTSPSLSVDGTIYIILHNQLHAVNPDGTQKWEFHASGQIVLAPAVDTSGNVYIGTNEGILYAISPDGTHNWEYIPYRGIATSPSIGSDGTIYIGTHDGGLHAVNSDGTLKWRCENMGIIQHSSPAIGADGTVYVGSEDSYLYAVKPDGTLKWQCETPGGISESSPAIGIDGTIYIGYGDNGFCAISPDGTLKWNIDDAGGACFPTIGADGTIYVGSGDGLHAYDPDGTHLWHFQSGGIYSSAPALGSDGIIYFGTNDSNFYALGTGTTGGLADSPWPKFGHDNRNTGSIRTISASPDNVRIMDVAAGSTGTGTFDIINTGNKTIVVSDISSSSDVFTVEPASTELAPGESRTVTVIFAPPDDRGYSGTITVTGEDITLAVDVYGNMHLPGEVVWTFQTGGTIENTPAIGDDGTIYVGSHDSYLYALNPDGTLQWRYQTGGAIPSAPAIGEDGTIYFGSTDGHLYAINPDGTLKWKYENGSYTSPAIGSDGTIYISSGDLISIHPEGTLKWKVSDEDYANLSNVIGKDGTIYYGVNEGEITYFCAYNPDGLVKWKLKASDNSGFSNPSWAIGADGTLYVGDINDMTFYAVNPDGTLKWSYQTGSHIYSSPSIDNDGTIYFQADGTYALNPDGTLKWKYDVGGRSSTLIGMDGTIYSGGGGSFVALNSDGSLKWEFELEPEEEVRDPAISNDGILYIGSSNGTLYAIGTGTTGGLAEDSPWPKFHYDRKNTGNIQEFGLSVSSIDFGNLSVGDSKTETSTIINYSDQDLVVEYIACDNNVFIVDLTSLTIAPNSGKTIAVTFTPLTIQEEPCRGTLTINTDIGPTSLSVVGAAPPPTVTVFSPNGGEWLETWSSHDISWTTWEVSDVTIEFSIDGGANWETLVESIDASDGTFSWTIPEIESHDCLVRISDVTNADVSDMSDELFTLSPPPTLILTSPNGGERWLAGSVQDITWKSYVIEKVWIEYSFDGGSSWRTITSQADARTGSNVWTVPDIESSDCIIKVSDPSDQGLTDNSDETFVVTSEAFLQLVSPIGGDTWWIGYTYDITWASSGISSVLVEFSSDGGTNWITIADEIDAVEGSVSWTVPEIESSEYLVRVKELEKDEYSDVNDDPFSATWPPNLEVTVPDGDEEWSTGSLQQITWTSTDIASIHIEFSSDGGESWVTLAESVEAQEGAFSWTIPDIESSDCLIRITDTANYAITDVSTNSFTISPEPFVQVMSPIGGEEWVVGDTYEITWSSAGVLTVHLEYSADNALIWTTIVESTDAASGSYSWTVPYVESSDCLVRIKDASNSELTDISDNLFTIFTVPAVELTSPNGAEEWTVTTSQTIAWEAAWIDSVKIEYSPDAGENWITIEESADAASGSYVWTVPENVSSTCVVRITDSDNADVTDVSDDMFAIVPESYIEVQSPNGGEEWEVGSKRTISWESYGIIDVRIDFSIDGGTNWSTIVESIDSSEGVFIWTVPDVESSECLVKITDTSDGTRQDIIDGTFNILKAQFIQVTSPNGGEKWEIQSTHEITWSMFGVMEVVIEYSSDSGFTWNTVVEKMDADKGTFTWILPEVESNDCLVMITDTTNAGLTDTSDTSFTILPPQYLEITSPNGGEEWETGSIQNITWSYIRVSTVKIEYSGDNGVQWLEIVESADASPGSFSWTIPDIESIKCLIRITDTSEPEVSDSSDETFAIYRRSFVTITSPSADDRWPSGSSEEITWKYSGITEVKIEYSTDRGSIWEEIISSESALTGSYSWLVPDVSSTECVIRISDATDSTIYDVNDGFFEIFLSEIRINHDPITKSEENEPITFDVQVTSEADIDNVILYYDVTGRRVFDQSEYLEKINESDYTATLGVGVFTTFGIEYYFTARAQNMYETRMPSGSGYYSICAVIPEATSGEEIKGGTEVTGYRMISIPLELSTDSIVEQLAGRQPTGNSGTDWRLFRFSPGSTTPLEYPDIEGFSPGKAFWLITINDYRLITPQGKTVTTSEPFNIILKPGWNDIANPWMFDISWDDIENPSGAKLSVLYSYEGSWSDPIISPNVLEPWKGYAVNNLSNINALIWFQPEPAGGAEKAVVKDEQIAWILTLKAFVGDAKDDANHLGVRNGSLEEWDEYDHVEPPPIGQYVSVYFPHRDWKQYPYDYTVDFRPPDDTVSWDFNVVTNIHRKTVTIELEGIEQLPDEYFIKIFDRDKEHEVDIINNTFGFVSGKDLTERHFTLVVSNSFEKQPEHDDSIPEQFVTSTSYPNPFNPQTTIQYELSHPGKVKISVFNSLGQRVRIYELGHREQGIHKLVFDASELTSGLYFYYVDADYSSVTGKMLYMK